MALRRLSSWRSLGQWGRGLLKRCPDSDSSYAIVIPVSEVKRQRWCMGALSSAPQLYLGARYKARDFQLES